MYTKPLSTSFELFEHDNLLTPQRSQNNYHFEFLSNDTLQIKYKDNMNLDNLINFSKQNDK